MRAEAPVPASVLDTIRAPLQAPGAVQADPPIIQPLNLMLDLAGEALRARLFIVQDEGGREACLRPDFTVAVARAHMEAGAGQARYAYNGKAFRVAPAGQSKTHPEEFRQVGLEIFGETSAPAADALIAGAAWRAAEAGGRSDLKIVLGDAGLFADFLKAIDVAPELRSQLLRSLGRPARREALLARAATGEAPTGVGADIAAMSPGEAEQAVAAAWAQNGLEPVGGRTAAEVAARLIARGERARAPRLTPARADLIKTYLGFEGRPEDVLEKVHGLTSGMGSTLEAWSARLDAMSSEGVDLGRAWMRTGFSRAFGYYDGFLFEIESDDLPPDAPVSAGGRYDGLTAALGGEASTAVGCMVRPARAWKEAGQ